MRKAFDIYLDSNKSANKSILLENVSLSSSHHFQIQLGSLLLEYSCNEFVVAQANNYVKFSYNCVILLYQNNTFNNKGLYVMCCSSSVVLMKTDRWH